MGHVPLPKVQNAGHTPAQTLSRIQLTSARKSVLTTAPGRSVGVKNEETGVVLGITRDADTVRSFLKAGQDKNE